jgi:hypothetical protein
MVNFRRAMDIFLQTFDAKENLVEIAIIVDF